MGVDLEWVNKSNTVGRLSGNDEAAYLKRFKRIGMIDIALLREYLKKIGKRTGRIGVYFGNYSGVENVLAPLHYKGWLLAPVLGDDVKGVDTSTHDELLIRNI